MRERLEREGRIGASARRGGGGGGGGGEEGKGRLKVDLAKLAERHKYVLSLMFVY